MSTTAKNSLTGTNGTSVIKKENKPKTIFDVIQAGAKQFETALPKHINTDRFVRIAITAIRQNPKLALCSQESLLGSLMVSAQLGLEPGGVLGQCYLIPYGKECQFQIGYKGMIELLRRSGQLADIYVYTVHKNDEFKITYGLDRNLIHIPNFDNPGEEIGYYAVAKLKDETKPFYFMTVKQIEEHAKRFSKTFNNGPWQTDFEAMAHKTVIKQLLKFLPVSVEFLENIDKDGKFFKTQNDRNISDYKEIEEKDIKLAETEEEATTVINEDTGEIINEDNQTDDIQDMGLFNNK